jgi:hypothetical protein
LGHQDDRIHDFLEVDVLNRQPVERKPSLNAVVIPNARVGCLHHRYAWREVA